MAGSARNPWWIVFGSTMALVAGANPVGQQTVGLFMQPLQAEFGWNRAEISLGISGMNLLGVMTLPVAGWMMDRWGVKRVVVPYIVLFAINMALLSTVASLPALITFYTLFGLTGAGLNPVGYIKSITAYFDERRGLAIGIAMAGTGIGAAVVPQFAQYVITQYGWRTAYIVLALIPALVALPCTLFLVREPQRHGAPSISREGAKAPIEADLPGFDTWEALATRTFWIVVGVTFLVSAVVNGMAAHIVPFLIDHGRPPAAAASILIVLGVASTVGRLCSGYLFDRIFAPYVAATFFVVCMLGIGLLAATSWPTFAIACVGLTLGLEIDLLAYLVPRYFGLRRFGQLYGLVFAAFAGGGAVGPLVMGTAFTIDGSYYIAFIAFGAMLLTAAGLILCLGPYTYTEPSERSRERTSDAEVA